jgi:hypothetical protein
MPIEPAEQVRRALQALASMANAREGRTPPGTIPLEWFSWVPVGEAITTTQFSRSGRRAKDAVAKAPTVSIDRRLGQRLATVDRIRVTGASTVRLGWLFVAGTTIDDAGRATKVFWPLVTMPVRVDVPAFAGQPILTRAGDVMVTERVADPAKRWELDNRIEWVGHELQGAGIAIDTELLAGLGGLHRFALDAAAACGWDATNLIPAGGSPERLMANEGLLVVAGLAVFLSADVGGLSSSATLGAWAGEQAHALTQWTSFHSMYAEVPDAPARPRSPEVAPPTASPFLLTPAQRAAVLASRTEPLTVIRGAPGTGKSHTITAIACDALARGETVLVAARSEATVEALIDLFERAPGPRPVVFGSNEQKDALADKLAGGLVAASDDELVRSLDALAEAVAWRRSVHDATVDALRIEQLGDDADSINAVRAAWPALFEPAFDIEAATELVERAEQVADGWLARRRQRRTRVRLCESVGTTPERWAALLRALDMARLARALPAEAARTGLTIPFWEDLRRSDDLVRERAAVSIELASRSEDRLDRKANGAVAALATALRSGRSARRQQLARLDDDLTCALPLWVGTLRDVDDLLPPIPSLFDVVILDEASSIDQPSAATTLLRGRRAVVVGDPQQLRHVSFLGDDERDEALTGSGIDLVSPLAAKLDVRRNSAFDVAVANAAPITLDEHFRCDPHLFDLVAERLYGGRVKVATRSPATASVDCVEVRTVRGARDRDGVVREEVQAVLDELVALHQQGVRSVGVVTPFRAQADALEDAILEHLDAATIEVLDLRVGTVHAFQGNERDVMIVSLGVGDGGSAASWRFAEDPHLFAVMATRARRQLVIVHAADPPAGGLLAEWLARADSPPGPPAAVPVLDEWTTSVARAVADTGVASISAYPSGRHLVDVCIGDDRSFLGVECSVHPDGPDAHIERHLALVRRGWHLVEGYPSRWADRRAELAVELARAVEPPR